MFIIIMLKMYFNKSDSHVPIISRHFEDFLIKKVPKAGHVIHFDNPSETVRIIDQFINQ